MSNIQFSFKNFNKPTPKWLSQLRNAYFFLGGGTLLSLYSLLNLDSELSSIIDRWYIAAGIVIQFVCKIGGYKFDETEETVVESELERDIVTGNVENENLSD